MKRLKVLVVFLVPALFTKCAGQRTFTSHFYIELPVIISGHSNENCHKDASYKAQILTFEEGFNDSVICVYKGKVVLDTLLKTHKTFSVVIKELVIKKPKKGDIVELYFLRTKQKAIIKLTPDYTHIYIDKLEERLDAVYSNCDREYY